jgi:hypothetical protein
MNEYDSLLSRLTPEQLQQMMELGSLDEQGGLLHEQMAQAEALRKPSGVQGYGAAGGLFHGLADGINNISGAIRQKQLYGEQKDLLGKKTKGRSTLVELLRSGPTQPQQPNPSPGFMPMPGDDPYGGM